MTSMQENRAAPASVAVIGGGPAGLMAAERLALAGIAVTVYERMPSPARKLLMAGRGGLNLTHAEPLDHFLPRYGRAAAWLGPIIRQFDNAALRQWAEDLGEATFKGSSDRIFPKSLKASPLLRAWLRRLDRLGVRIATRHTWQGFTADGGLAFEAADGSTLAVHPAATILALGGASWPRLGADGGWVAPLRAAGVEVTDLEPANTGITIAWSPHLVERFAGAPLKTVAVTFRGQTVKGDLVVTAYGLEGGPVYAMGPAIRTALARDGATDLSLDLKPDTSEASLGQRLAKAMGKGRSRANALRQAGLSPLAAGILRETTPALPTEPGALAALIKAAPLRVTGQAGLARAISTAGGIAAGALDDRLMLKALPGTFACGEMLDWEAPTGGYLLQACFATGSLAAEGALAWLEQQGHGC
jgi:uncharacterized flavoprotein (TIGR03862 family)